MASDLKQRMAPGDLLVHEGPIENSGALEFYSGRRPMLLDARRSILGMGATYPEARAAFWDARDLARAWHSGRRVFLVTPRAPEQSAVASLPPRRRASARGQARSLALQQCQWPHGRELIGPPRMDRAEDLGCGAFASCATVNRCALRW